MIMARHYMHSSKLASITSGSLEYRSSSTPVCCNSGKLGTLNSCILAIFHAGKQDSLKADIQSFWNVGRTEGGQSFLPERQNDRSLAFIHESQLETQWNRAIPPKLRLGKTPDEIILAAHPRCHFGHGRRAGGKCPSANRLTQ
jgi:hypothetical protein